MQVEPTVTLPCLRAGYKKACETSNASRRVHRRRGHADRPNTKRLDLRAILLLVITENARHVGHADIIREQIDGQTGR